MSTAPHDILDLGGRVALVTGAGQGVGRQIALHLARHGAGGVAVNDYVLDRAEAVVEEIHAEGGKAVAVQADVSRFRLGQGHGGPHRGDAGRRRVLVNNAGNMGAHPTPELRRRSGRRAGRVATRHRGQLRRRAHCVSAVVPGLIERNAPAGSSRSSPTPAGTATPA